MKEDQSIMSDNFHVKNNWHAKKMANKIRDFKKAPYDLPKAIDRAIYNAEKDNYETVTVKDIYNQLVTVTIYKETKELIKNPFVRQLAKKSLSLKEMKKVYDGIDLSQKLKTIIHYNVGSSDYFDDKFALNEAYLLNQTVYNHKLSIGRHNFTFTAPKRLMQEGQYTIEEIRVLLPKKLVKQFDKKLADIERYYYKVNNRTINKKQYIKDEKFKKYNEVMKYRDEEIHSFCFCKYCKNRNKKERKFKHKNLTQLVKSKPLDYQNYID